MPPRVPKNSLAGEPTWKPVARSAATTSNRPHYVPRSPAAAQNPHTNRQRSATSKSAATHDRVAQVHDTAQSEGVGNAAAHHTAAGEHREAAMDDRSAADTARDHADEEQR
jgi:hypothetical protein